MVMATSDVASACADLQVVLSLAWCCVNCSALFVITLSEEEPRDGDELFHLVLHGNREVWADKSMNLVRSWGACWHGNRARGAALIRRRAVHNRLCARTVGRAFMGSTAPLMGL